MTVVLSTSITDPDGTTIFAAAVPIPTADAIRSTSETTVEAALLRTLKEASVYCDGDVVEECVRSFHSNCDSSARFKYSTTL